MSVFREATKYIHGDKLWSWNPANHLKDIKISKISTIEAGQMHRLQDKASTLAKNHPIQN